MEREGVEAKNTQFEVRFGKPTASFQLTSEIRGNANSTWGKVSIACERFDVTSSKKWNVECAKNVIQHPQLTSTFQLRIQAQNNLLGQVARNTDDYQMTLGFSDTSFSDEQGLHAGERLSGQWVLSGSPNPMQAQGWRWQTDLLWQSGGVFWQPFYVESSGHRLQAKGVYNSNKLSVEQADLVLKDIAKLHFTAEVLIPDASRALLNYNQLQLQASEIDLAKIYPLLLKPLLENGAMSKLEMDGQANLSLSVNNGTLQKFQLTLQQADVEDENGRFAFYKVNADIPWSFDDLSQAKLAYQGGHLLHIPLGSTHLAATLNRYSLTVKQMEWPILDGVLNVADVSAAWLNQQWHWHMRAELTPIDMEALSKSLGWPRMAGKVAASIPLVTYSAGELSTDGEMKFSVFNGSVVTEHLAMQNPLGVAPRLTTDLKLRNLDLGDLTRTFSFGAIEGKLDGDVNNLVLSDWQPISFDADLHSSEGRYPKKISQRAVENISALGGAGAAAAVQRSFLRFLKEFNYEKIGLSCHLSNDTCEMRGVESTPQGYIIVKGSGIPAITVMGYNHSVGWSELLARVKRITADNAAVIK